MRKFSIFLFAILFDLYNFSVAQEEKQLNIEAGISLFTFEMNGETLNHGIEPKFVFGPYLNLFFSNLSWISGIEFGINNIDDDCTTCNDDFYGIGKLTELNVSSGVRYTFMRNKPSPVLPFVESDIYYSYSTYEGSFSGGLSGDGTLRDNTYNSLGILGRAGLSFYPAPSIAITISASIKAGYVKANYRLTGKTETYTGLTTVTPLQLRFGYLF